MVMINIVALCYTSALAIILLLQAALQDQLLYHSDIFSYSYFTFVLSLPVFVILVLCILLAKKFVFKKSDTSVNVMVGFLTMLITFGLTMQISDMFIFSKLERGLKKLNIVTSDHMEPVLSLMIFLLIIPMSIFATKHLLKKQDMKHRIMQLARFVSAASLVCGIAFVGFTAYQYFQESTIKMSSTSPQKHMIMIVIDGMPTSLIKTYNPQTAATTFDKIIQSGTTYKNAYSNKVFTSGYFGALYSGKLSLGLNGRDDSALLRQNLFGILQENKVKTRLITFHPSGIPESNSITQYKGLKGSFLTEYYSWLPEFLKLDYNVFLEFPTTRTSMGKRVQAVYEKVSKWENVKTEANLWNRYIFDQIKSLHNASNNSFLILHVSFSGHSIQSGKSDDPDIEALYHRVKKTDYAYNNEDEAWVGKVKSYYKNRINFYGEKISQLMDFLKQNNMLDNTTVLITADHGTILEKNKIFYGFHADEEVTKVPFVVFANKAKISNEYIDSQDIAKSIISYFAVDQNDFALAGRNFLTKNSFLTEKIIPVYTTKSNLRNEHFIVFYKDHCKHTFNIHPQSKGDVNSVPLSKHSEQECRSLINRSEFTSALGVFNIHPEEIHENFKGQSH